MPNALRFANYFTVLVGFLLVGGGQAKSVQLSQGNSSLGDTVHEHAQNVQNATDTMFNSSSHNKSYTKRARHSHKASVSSRDNMQNIYNSISSKPSRANMEMRRGVNKNPVKPNSLRNLLQLSGHGVSSDSAASTLDKFVIPPMPIPLPKVPLPVKTVTAPETPITPVVTAEHLTPVKVSLVDLFNSDLVDFRTIINSPDWQKKFKDLVIAIEAYESKYFERNPPHAENSNARKESRDADALKYNSFDADFEFYDGDEVDESDDYSAGLPLNTTEISVIPEETTGTWISEVHNLPQPSEVLYTAPTTDTLNKTV